MYANLDLTRQFEDYLVPGELPWIEAGLIPDAPEAARKAYEEWKAEELDAKKNEET